MYATEVIMFNRIPCAISAVQDVLSESGSTHLLLLPGKTHWFENVLWHPRKS